MPSAHNGIAVEALQLLPDNRVVKGNSLPAAQSLSLTSRQHHSRDTGQHGFDRQQAPAVRQNMLLIVQPFQWNCIGFAERSDRQATQRCDMTECAEMRREIARESSHISSLADDRFEIGVLGTG